MVDKSKDPQLQTELRAALGHRSDIVEKRMFGGQAFMLDGKMLCTAGKGRFMFRVGRETEAEALALPGTTLVEMKGRPMPGYIVVQPDQAHEIGLETWIAMAERYVRALPEK
ncbi:TfoX/Sxy family protein [Cucumibacter marinus]|uniref:TfoX/Sxy family protein n=1 Tax=Cucumibacter marinus TaxID=1121252 RepID=UPI0003F55930|nr:TfoX/Sxy family protein [Cucumibacter marinus]